MFKKGMLLVLIALFAFFSTVGSVSAEKSAVSKANITFTIPDDTPPVLDPTDPEEPYEPTDPSDPQDEPTNQAGALTLDYVSSVNFDEQPIDASEQIYQSTTLRPFIQVTDRRGTGEGWHVTAKMGAFTNEGQESLPGAELTFTNGTVISKSTSTSAAPTPSDPVALVPGEDAVMVVNAAEDEGLGSWLTRWFPKTAGEKNDSVTLTVPAGAATIGNHTAEITWTLTAAPN